ncbi:hypothetical protein CASFOL_005709 [Castilleja foliolosa]|uniref:Uncharacterized protein n=1 Tax=Castilleja foliolosa TaxID=1961234 RepID=A0ABD3E5A6_9LAMI
MADSGRAARLLRIEKRKAKGKAKVGEPSDYTSDDDQSEEYEPGPDSGNNPVVIADEKELAHYNFPLFVPGCQLGANLARQKSGSVEDSGS